MDFYKLTKDNMN